MLLRTFPASQSSFLYVSEVFYVSLLTFLLVYFGLVHFYGARIHLDKTFWFAFVHQSNSRLNCLFGVYFFDNFGINYSYT